MLTGSVQDADAVFSAIRSSIEGSFLRGNGLPRYPRGRSASRAARAEAASKMSANELELRPLRLDDAKSFLDAVAEVQSEPSPLNFALGLGDGETFEQYVQKLEGWPRGEGLPANFVPGVLYVGVVHGEVVGRVSVRFRLTEKLARVGGHIGYVVRPSQRRRGYATRMLQLSLPICRGQGINPALITCDVDNVGSRQVIERCGGVFESITDDPTIEVQKRRYWIATA